MNKEILKIDGWMTETELDWLYNMAMSMPTNSLIVEIGAWKGRSTAALYTGAGMNKAVVTVDTWQGQPDIINMVREAKQNDIFGIFINNMYSLGIIPQLYIPNTSGPQYIYSDSIYASECFYDNSIEFLFIDGDHTNAWKDLIAWFPKIHVGGIISGHDYNWTGVYHAVNSILGKIDGLVGSIWIKQKVGF